MLFVSNYLLLFVDGIIAVKTLSSISITVPRIYRLPTLKVDLKLIGQDPGQILFDSVPQNSIRWGCKLLSVDQDRTLHFEQEFESGFDLVVGVDEARSCIRSLLSNQKPPYSGISRIEFSLEMQRNVTRRSAGSSTAALSSTGTKNAVQQLKSWAMVS
jgi:hypothetical protein